MTDPLEVLSVADLRRRTSAKWRTHPDDVLPLWVAEMDAPVAEPIARAVADALAIGDAGYVYGTLYAEAVAAFAQERWGWAFEPTATSIMPDVMQGVVHLLDLVTGPGDAVVVDPPVYPPFYTFVERAGRRIVEAPLDAAFRLDPAALDQAFAEARADGRPAAWLLSNPHNPTGTAHTAAELAVAVAVATRHGVRIIADEIHAPLVLTGASHVPILTVPGAADAFALVSATKAWGLAGLKAALAVAGPDALDDLARVPPEVKYGASQIGVIAQTAAFRAGGPWLDDLLVALDDRRRLLVELVREHLPTAVLQRPEATYLAWLDCRALGLGDDPAVAFLERGRVALQAGPPFGTGGAGHVRVNMATSQAILREAVRRMAETAAAVAVPSS